MEPHLKKRVRIAGRAKVLIIGDVDPGQSESQSNFVRRMHHCRVFTFIPAGLFGARLKSSGFGFLSKASKYLSKASLNTGKKCGHQYRRSCIVTSYRTNAFVCVYLLSPTVLDPCSSDSEDSHPCIELRCNCCRLCLRIWKGFLRDYSCNGSRSMGIHPQSFYRYLFRANVLHFQQCCCEVPVRKQPGYGPW